MHATVNYSICLVSRDTSGYLVNTPVEFVYVFNRQQICNILLSFYFSQAIQFLKVVIFGGLSVVLQILLGVVWDIWVLLLKNIFHVYIINK